MKDKYKIEQQLVDLLENQEVMLKEIMRLKAQVKNIHKKTCHSHVSESDIEEVSVVRKKENDKKLFLSQNEKFIKVIKTGDLEEVEELIEKYQLVVKDNDFYTLTTAHKTLVKSIQEIKQDKKVLIFANLLDNIQEYCKNQKLESGSLNSKHHLLFFLFDLMTGGLNLGNKRSYGGNCDYNFEEERVYKRIELSPNLTALLQDYQDLSDYLIKQSTYYNKDFYRISWHTLVRFNFIDKYIDRYIREEFIQNSYDVQVYLRDNPRAYKKYKNKITIPIRVMSNNHSYDRTRLDYLKAFIGIPMDIFSLRIEKIFSNNKNKINLKIDRAKASKVHILNDLLGRDVKRITYEG